jgi:hypothetical protein
MASIYGRPIRLSTAIDKLMIAIIFISNFINAECLSFIMVGFIHWIRGDYHKYIESTHRSTSLWKRGQKIQNKAKALKR